MNNIDIVTCAGFGGSGSSAITDILKEFEAIKSLGSFEFTLAHELDGISDLEYYLVDNKHRLNCDLAIFRFKKLVDRINNGYSLYINNFKEISNDYIKSIIQLEWEGYWHNHELRYSKLNHLLYFKIPTKIQTTLNKIRKSEYEIVPKFKKDRMFYSSLTENEFLEKTRNYTNEIIKDIIKSNFNESVSMIALDQLVSPNQIGRYTRYFKNMKVILVDRDPRDIFLLNQLYWNEGWIPSNDIDIFIKWFKQTRNSMITDEYVDKNVLRVKFEDLIYNYDCEINRVYKFLNTDEEHHKDKMKYFNPEISKKNTELWNKKEANIYTEEIERITKELSEFCN